LTLIVVDLGFAVLYYNDAIAGFVWNLMPLIYMLSSSL